LCTNFYFQVDWNFRKQGGKEYDCYTSVDGSDFRINEPTPFSTKWYSHKHNGPGLRYEIAVSIFGGRIVWASGPFKCGENSDVSIFRRGLKKRLDTDEFVIADNGYHDERCITPPRENHPLRKRFSQIRARHETVNGRMKQFRVLRETFHHPLHRHADCFFAVLNITYLMLDEEPLFDIHS